jgi:nickel-dependent lactate racemase
MLFRHLAEELAPRAARLDFMIALGTHSPLDEEGITKLVGMPLPERQKKYPNLGILNHQWDNPEILEKIGEIRGSEVAEATGGLLTDDVDIVLNRRVLRDYDLILICGPVFPHEVVGFSGGNKYLFPGVSGDTFLQFFHWLGAIITNPRAIGHQWTPMRRFVERAARLVPVPRLAFCFAVDGGELAGIYFGEVEEAWSSAVEVSRKRHIRYVERPFRSVLAEAPLMYDDLWVGGKCMYKLEPALADGAELIIFAPHIREVSPVHGKVLDEIGYHILQYFTADWERFRRHPWGVVAHSTHVRGIGNMENGVERPRVQVTLATGIPEDRCRKINLGYRDHVSIRREDWMGREEEGFLYVPHAGEVLHRLKNPPDWAKVD